MIGRINSQLKQKLRNKVFKERKKRKKATKSENLKEKKCVLKRRTLKSSEKKLKEEEEEEGEDVSSIYTLCVPLFPSTLISLVYRKRTQQSRQRRRQPVWPLER